MMPTRNVVITDRRQQLVEPLVASGRYQNASEVLRDGLRLVEEREPSMTRKSGYCAQQPKPDSTTRK